MRQLFFLEGVLSKDPCDPVKLAYEETKKFGSEKIGHIIRLVYERHITFL